MKLSKFPVGLGLIALSILASCRKEEATVLAPVPVNGSDAKVSGVAADDPAKLARIPMIVSKDFLLQAKEFPGLMLSGKGRPRPGGTGGDTTPPTVSIGSPGNGATLSGTVSIQVNAADNSGLVNVTLLVDGVSIQTLSVSPYNFTWNSASVGNGTHTLTATAVDGSSNATSASISFSTANNSGGDVSSPMVVIISPSNGAALVGAVQLQSSATDNVGVASVSYDVDGTAVGSSNASPYTVNWNTAAVANGAHNITATARDAAGNMRTHTIQVTVNATVLPASSLPASYQLMMPPVMNQGSEGSCVSFATVYAARSAEQYYKTNASSYSPGVNQFSPEYAFNQVNLGGDCTSSAVTPNLDLMVSQGVCTWQSMPYSSTNGCGLMPNSAQTSEAANYKIRSYSAIMAQDQVAIKSMIVGKHPVIATVNIDNQFYGATPGFIWNSWTNNSGFHGITICGYDDAKHAYKAMNSWGTNWGDGGYIWIDYDFFPTVSSYYTYILNL